MPSIEFAIVIALTALNGLLSMSELAVVSAREARLKAMAEAGSRGATAALRLRADPSGFLSTVQMGITLIGVVAGAYGGAALGETFAGALREAVPAATEHAETIGMATAVALVTYLSLVIGELVPKRIAIRNPESIAVAAATPLAILARAGAPFVWILKGSTEGLLRLVGLHGDPKDRMTEDEVKSVISEGAEAGVFHPAEHAMLESVMRLADRDVRAVMTPRPDVVWLDADDPAPVWAAKIEALGYSRYPVCRGQVDEFVGVVSAKRLLTAALSGRELDLAAISEPTLVVHDGMPVLRLLELMKQGSGHLALVVDEYGSLEGLVTLTDVMQAIAGDMPENGDSPAAVTRADGSWLIDGMMVADEVGRIVDAKWLDSPGDGWTTLGGFLLHTMGRIPTVGDTMETRGLRFEIVDMDGRRIDKVLVSKIVEAQNENFAHEANEPA